MKKQTRPAAILLGVALTFAVLAVACGGNAKPGPAADSTTAADQTAQPPKSVPDLTSLPPGTLPQIGSAQTELERAAVEQYRLTTVKTCQSEMMQQGAPADKADAYCTCVIAELLKKRDALQLEAIGFTSLLDDNIPDDLLDDVSNATLACGDNLLSP